MNPEARQFFDWHAALEIAAKVFVPGNHPTTFEPVRSSSTVHAATLPQR